MPLWQTHLSALITLPRLKIAGGSLLCRAVIFGLITLLCLAVPSLSRAQGVISTAAGTTWSFFGDDGPAILASLDGPTSVAVDAAGNIFIADRNNNLVRKVGADGIITTVAGNGDFSFAGDGGPATAASLDPQGVAVDAAGQPRGVSFDLLHWTGSGNEPAGERSRGSRRSAVGDDGDPGRND